MSKTLIVDYDNNLVMVDGISKRLPIRSACDHAFGVLAWDGNAGSITYLSGGLISFGDATIAQPFIDAWEVEPPQLVPERIGSARQMDPPDQEWIDLVARHKGLSIAIAAKVKAASDAVANASQAKAAAERARRAAFQAHMNAVRRSKGRPEVNYAD